MGYCMYVCLCVPRGCAEIDKLLFITAVGVRE